MFYQENALSIKAWAEEDRPREKLLLKGKTALSASELLAIIIGSGNQELSAVSLAKQILNFYKNDLNLLAKASVSELQKFKGIGEAKSIAIVACIELGRRRKYIKSPEKSKIISSHDAYQVLASLMSDLNHEEFKVLLLNRQNKIIKIYHLSSGGIAGTVVDPKLIFKEALAVLSSGIILCHNHPSGNLKPSTADIEITKKLQQAGSLLDINVLDHLIISNEGYYSFADEGLM